MALLFSSSGLPSKLQVLEWNVPGTPWPSDTAPRKAEPGPASCYCGVHGSHLLPGTDTGKTMPARSAHGRSRRPPAYQQVPPGEGKREQRRSNEELRQWSPPPGSSGPGSQASSLQQSSFSGPSSALLQNGNELLMYMQMPRWEGKLGELAFLMKQDHRERAEVMSNNLL